MSYDARLSDHDYLEHLRRQADKVNALEHRIEQLEQQRKLLKEEAAALERQLSEYRQIRDEWGWFFENALDLLLVHDSEGRLSRVNPAVERVLGYSPDEFMRIPREQMIHPDDLQQTLDHMVAIEQGRDGVNFVSRCRHKDGSWRWLAWTTPAPGEGAVRRSYAVARDITESKLTEQELLHRAQHDALTGLANRAMFDQCLELALARLNRHAKAPLALLLLDLDGFKTVNDTHGHLVGDGVLKAVAQRLRTIQRSGDVIARLGGDEFACLIEGADHAALDAVATRMLVAIREPVMVGQLGVSVGCSIGIAAWRPGDASASALFERADRAMYSVKSAGKCGVAHAPAIA